MCLADISIIFAPKIEKKGRKTMRLSELNTGEKGVIVKVLGHGGFRKRIVEMGFMTNQSDDLKMADSSFQQTMAEGIANGIDAYFQ